MPGKRMLLMGSALCVVLVAGGLVWRYLLASGAVTTATASPGATLLFGRPVLPTLHHPFIEFLKLVAAFLIGELVTTVHRVTHRGKPLDVAIQQAQVLLCVAGALMMIIIGDSLARAFGVAGGASIVRFRTPVQDPKDSMILFLALGLGMACGLGAFAIAGLGTAFLCTVLVWLSYSATERPRAMMLRVSAGAAGFPRAHVESVLSLHGIQFEAREVSDGAGLEVSYKVSLDRDLSIDELNEELREGGGAGITGLAWEKAKKQG